METKSIRFLFVVVYLDRMCYAVEIDAPVVGRKKNGVIGFPLAMTKRPLLSTHTPKSMHGVCPRPRARARAVSG